VDICQTASVAELAIERILQTRRIFVIDAFLAADCVAENKLRLLVTTSP
jgi:hypothetical protein